MEEENAGLEGASAEIKNDAVSTSNDDITLKVVYRKNALQVASNVESTVGELKTQLESLTGVPVAMMKLMYKGALNDDSKQLKDLKISNGAKMMVVGSTATDLLKAVPTQVDKTVVAEPTRDPVKEPLSTQRPHSRIVGKGKPDDAMTGTRRRHDRLPTTPLSGMVNKDGSKVRLTFKLELDQFWLETKERTRKIPMTSVHSIVSEPIAGHEDYHMLAFQLGPTELSRYWIYWVPAQYVRAIKDTVLGPFTLR
ncbi:ubiquitin domain-containing protein UBFD1-like [Oscarella lobularis]|uniref:ubiquitin domain-containing protein UBFD1-like n=1 Tax=Oscarella lobularis TaxID=121494 RepID=UPI0033135CED